MSNTDDCIGCGKGGNPEDTWEYLCPQCLADLRLGRLVRAMPPDATLENRRGEFWEYITPVRSDGQSVFDASTPEAAIILQRNKE